MNTHVLTVPINRRQKTLACVHCDAPVDVDANATRCVCSACITAGKSLPREHQVDLNLQPA